MLDLCFLYKVVNNALDSSQLVERINFNIPRPNTRLKNYVPFKQHFCKTNLGISAPLNRIMKLYNSVSVQMNLDIFNDSLPCFKDKIKKYYASVIKK